MREIKFRAYCKKRKEFVRIVDLGLFGTGEVKSVAFTYKDDPYERIDCDLPGDVELMQNTGLKDKNGVEIYEGDILKSYEEDQPTYTRDFGGGITDLDFEGGHIQIGIVEFISCSFSYKTVRTITGEHQHKEIPIDWLDNYEVLGNIYENPELLGDSQ